MWSTSAHQCRCGVMKIFRKLIRDNVPELMAAEGKKLKVRTLDGAEFITALENKLIEEIQEMRQAADAEERKSKLAYLYEVIETLIAASGFSESEIREIQNKDRSTRGGFSKRLFLEGVEE